MIINLATDTTPYAIKIQENNITIQNNNGFFINSPIHPIDCKFVKIYQETEDEKNNLILYIRDNVSFAFTTLMNKLIPLINNKEQSFLEIEKEVISEKLIYNKKIKIEGSFLSKNNDDKIYVGKSLSSIEINYNLVIDNINWTIRQLIDYVEKNKKHVLVIHNNEIEIEKMKKDGKLDFIALKDFKDFSIFKTVYDFVYITDFEMIVNGHNKLSIINQNDYNLIGIKIRNMCKMGSKFLVRQINNTSKKKINILYSPLFCYNYFNMNDDGFDNLNMLWFGEYFNTEVIFPNLSEIEFKLSDVWEKQINIFKNNRLSNEKYFITSYFPKWVNNNDIKNVLNKIKIKGDKIEDKISKMREKINYFKKEKIEELNFLTNNDLIMNRIEKITNRVSLMEGEVIKYKNKMEMINQLKNKYINLESSLQKKREENNNHIECPICLENVNIEEESIYLSCGHWLCSGCCSKLLVDNKISCPLCRGKCDFNESFMLKSSNRLGSEYLDPKFNFYINLLKKSGNDINIILFENQKIKNENEVIFKKICEKIKLKEIRLETISNFRKILDSSSKNDDKNRIDIILGKELKDEFMNKCLNLDNYKNLRIKLVC